MEIIAKINKLGAKEEFRYNIVYKEQKLPMLKTGMENVQLLHFSSKNATFSGERGVLIIPVEDIVAMYPVE